MIEFEWWMWIVIGVLLGIWAEHFRRQGKHAIPFEVRYWFSEHWPALVVCMPIAIGFGAVVSMFIFSFLGLAFATWICFIVLFCDMAPILWLLWVTRTRKTKEVQKP